MKYALQVDEIKNTWSPPLHKGTVDRTLIDPSLAPKNFTVIMGELQPGGEAHAHSHAMEQFVFILCGKQRFEIGDETFEVGPHTAIFIPANTPHRISNAGTTISRGLVVLSPPPAMKDGKPVSGEEWKEAKI